MNSALCNFAGCHKSHNITGFYWPTASLSSYQHSHTSPLSSNELLKQLHWLPIEWRIRFKLATITFNALHTDRPPPVDLLHHHQPNRSLHSSSSHQRLVPRHKLTFGSRLPILPRISSSTRPDSSKDFGDI